MESDHILFMLLVNMWINSVPPQKLCCRVNMGGREMDRRGNCEALRHHQQERGKKGRLPHVSPARAAFRSA